MALTELWKFAESFDQSRLERLSAITHFSQVIELIQDSIKHVSVDLCRGRNTEVQNCIQPVFTLTISEEAFDAFFNSPSGYRACYLHDPIQGLAANLRLIEALSQRLLTTAIDSGIPELDSKIVSNSICASSSKVWVYENDFPFQSPTQDLAIEAWVRAASNGEKRAIWGLCAPSGKRIQIKGALLDSWGNEVVPRVKILRNYDIHRFGFT